MTNEYLVRIDVEMPAAMPDAEWDAVMAREAERARGYRRAGVIVRIWRIPGTRSNIGIWSAASASELHDKLSALPAYPYMKISVQPLAQHYVEL